VLTTPHRKNVSCYEMFIQKASNLDRYSLASLNDGGYVLRSASIGDFVVVRTCTYANLDSTV